MRGKIRLYDDTRANATWVSNIFIENYMPKAPGEYVKIYLYLLRCMSSKKCEFSISSLSDIFDFTERDVRRGLEYWEQNGLLSLSFDHEGVLTGVCISTSPEIPAENKPVISYPEAEIDRTTDTVPPSAKEYTSKERCVPSIRDVGADELAALREDSRFSQLLFIIEKYLGRPLNPSDMRYLIYWHSELSMSDDLIMYLVETNLSGKYSTLRKMNEIAADWYRLGITTQADARSYQKGISDVPELSSEVIATVTDSFGITGRALGTLEKEYASKWSIDWGFDSSLIAEACKRALSKTGRSNFEYANRILENWKKQNVFSFDAISASDKAHKETEEKKYAFASKTSERRNPPTGVTSIKKGFRDFAMGGGYDFEELERKLALH